MALWPCAQATAKQQRAGTYLPECREHPGKMLPDLARRIVRDYSRAGDLVVDPMCGTGTTLVEAARLERRAIGVAAGWSTSPRSPADSPPTPGSAICSTSWRCMRGSRDGRLIGRPSFWQLSQVRRARGAGHPVHLVAHEDVLVFIKPEVRRG